MKVKDIVIVGGGSAGWMTASILIKSFPNKKITVIESPSIPKVGVGESTYDGINYYLEYLGIDKDSFFAETDASIKLGIEFVDFYEKDSGSFLYPFGIADTSDTLWGMQDWMIEKYCYPEISNQTFAESYFPASFMIKHNTFYDNEDNVLPNFDPRVHTAFHFDANKFGLWLKNRYCIPRGVGNTVVEIKDASVNNEERKINYLVTENDEKIYADLFIDCTGFRSLLLGQYLKEPFINYNDILPNNRAWATQIPYKDIENELETTTRCTAIKNGWVWNIPLYSRLGSGYVYSDKFIDKDDALDEFKNYLLSDKMVSSRTKEEVDSLSFKDIQIRVGRHKNIWVNNVVAIGLSAAFIEPLESNGLFSVHEFLFQLVRSLQREFVSSWDIYSFNEKTKDTYEGFVEFVKLHYALSIRNDSDYWISNSKTQYDFERLPHTNVGNANLFQMFEQKTKTYIPYPHGGFLTGVACISTGMNYPILDPISARMGEIQYNIKYIDSMEIYFKNLENKRNQWEFVAKNSPKLYDYLKNRYHGDQK